MEVHRLLVDTEDWFRFGDDWKMYLSNIKNKIKFDNIDQEVMFVNNMLKWSNTYNPSYMSVRQQIKDIAMRNHEKLGIRTKSKNDLFNYNSGDIYLITDDDDWFNPDTPNIVVELFKKNPNIDLVHWTCWQYTTTYRYEQFSAYNDGGYSIGSNGFAIKAHYTNFLDKWGIHSFVGSVMPNEKMLKCDFQKALSVWNIHPASFWQRMHYDLTNYINLLKRAPKPTELAWASDEIDEFYNVITSINKKPTSSIWCGRDPVRLL